MKQKYIIVKGAAGLGNRLITLTTAITYAKRTNRHLIVDWSEGQYSKKGLNAFFQAFDLRDVSFEEKIDDIENKDALTIYPKAWKGHLHDYNYAFKYTTNSLLLDKVMQKLGLRGEIGKLSGFWQPRDEYTRNPAFKHRLKGIFSKKYFSQSRFLSHSHKEDIIVYLDFQPAKFVEADFLKHIVLKPHINKIIEDYSNKFGLDANTVGIHVRSTDRMPTKDVSTILHKVKKLGLDNPQVFLATDNSDVYNSLKKDFPKLISFSEHVVKPPGANRGIHHHFNDETAYDIYEQSIIDMWLLSKCQYLFWQGNSSFSLISKILHKDKSKVFDWMAD